MRNCMLLVGILLLVGCSKDVSDVMPKEAFIDIKLKDIEVYDEVYVTDLISDTNVLVEDYKLNTEVIGEKDIMFYYTFNNNKYVYKTRVNVVDNVKPKIFGSSSKTVKVGYDGDLCNTVTYGDNYDNQAICRVIGEYDYNKVGKYDLEIEVTDNSGNSANYNITLNVVDEIKSSNNNNGGSSTKLAFSDAYNKYKTDETELGIDVSEWQGDIDYEKVRDAGVTFVMIRVGVKLNSVDEPILDKQFINNITNAHKAGLKVGVYLYSKALSSEEAIDEAKWVLKQLDGEKLELPIVFDWEIWNNWNTYHMSFHDLNKMAYSFIKTVEDEGYGGMLYGSKFYLENFWEDSEFENIWLAHYASSTTYDGYMMWQFSNVGKVDGVSGDVDLNVMIK